MKIFFQRIHKTLLSGHFQPFLPKFWQKWIFLEKKGSITFWIFQLSTIVQKIRKQIMTHSWNRQTDRPFSGKRALSVSEYSSYLPPCKKEKIIMTHSWKTDRETFLWKKVLPVSEYSSYLPLCKKSKKNNDPFLKQPDRQADLFLEKRALSASEYSSYLPSCKKSETNNDPFLIQTDRQTFFWKDGGQKKKERKKEKTLQ